MLLRMMDAGRGRFALAGAIIIAALVVLPVAVLAAHAWMADVEHGL